MARRNSLVYIIGAFAAIGGFLFGYDIGVISGVLTMDHFKEQFPLTPFKKGSVVSSLLAGCFGGALFSGYIADRLGRRLSILWGSVIFVVGALLQASSYSFVQLYFGRVIAGISVGILSAIVPLYQSEVSPKEIRGRLVSIQQWAITIGIAVSFWIDYGMSHVDHPAQWRVPLGIQALPAIVLAVGSIFLPFSPRWLMDHDRNEEALTVLSNLHGGGNKADPVVVAEYNEIHDSVMYERKYAAKSYMELLKSGTENVRRRMLLGVFIQIFQQLTGINAIIYYAPQIFQSAGLSSNSSSLLATGINGMVNMLSTIPAILYMDKWGRRPTLIVGAIGMFTALLITGSVLATHSTKEYDSSQHTHTLKMNDDPSSYTVIVFIYVFIANFAFSWGPCGWIYPAEIYPLRIRSKAISITTAANWLFNFAVGQLVPVMLDRITWGTYLVFASFCFIMACSIYAFYPETKGLSLEEMDVVFGGKRREKSEIETTGHTVIQETIKKDTPELAIGPDANNV